eukprot:6196249-Amphidinium_carterae.1
MAVNLRRVVFLRHVGAYGAAGVGDVAAACALHTGLGDRSVMFIMSLSNNCVCKVCRLYRPCTCFSLDWPCHQQQNM